MSKGGSQTVTTKLDPGYTAYRDKVFTKAGLVGAQGFTPYNGEMVAGVDPRYTAGANQIQNLARAGSPLMQGYGQLAGGLGLGLGAMQDAAGRSLAGADLSGYRNPYMQNVIDASRAEFGNTRALTSQSVNDAATKAGAFGGGRHGVAEGQALADLGRSENSMIASLLQSGYGDAQNQFLNDRNFQYGAGQGLANLGMSGLQGIGNTTMLAGQTGMQAGDYNRNVANQQNAADYSEFLRKQGWSQQQLNAMLGPLGAQAGMSQTTPTYSNPILGGLGAALGAAAIPGITGGAVLGAGGLGLLGSFF